MHHQFLGESVPPAVLSKVADSRNWLSGRRQIIAGIELSVAGCRLLVVGCWLSVAGCRLLARKGLSGISSNP
jgi:hypothetical protein